MLRADNDHQSGDHTTMRSRRLNTGAQTTKNNSDEATDAETAGQTQQRRRIDSGATSRQAAAQPHSRKLAPLHAADPQRRSLQTTLQLSAESKHAVTKLGLFGLEQGYPGYRVTLSLRPRQWVFAPASQGFR